MGTNVETADLKLALIGEIHRPSDAVEVAIRDRGEEVSQDFRHLVRQCLGENVVRAADPSGLSFDQFKERVSFAGHQATIASLTSS